MMDEMVAHASYYLLCCLLLFAGFGSAETDSSSHRISQSTFAVDPWLVLAVLLHLKELHINA